MKHSRYKHARITDFQNRRTVPDTHCNTKHKHGSGRLYNSAPNGRCISASNGRSSGSSLS